MKIGIDFHGVIDSNPRIFKKIIDTNLIAGNEVWIVTGCGTLAEEVETTHIFLEENGIRPTGVIFTGIWNLPDEDWEKAKAKWCVEHDIKMFIDDKEKFLKHFPDDIVTLKYSNNWG